MSEKGEKSVRVKGEEQVYLVCKFLKFLPAEHTPHFEPADLKLELEEVWQCFI